MLPGERVYIRPFRSTYGESDAISMEVLFPALENGVQAEGQDEEEETKVPECCSSSIGGSCPTVYISGSLADWLNWARVLAGIRHDAKLPSFACRRLCQFW